MQIINQPDSLSLLGNIKPFYISSSLPIVFKLYKGNELILDEKYNPSPDEKIKINVKDVINGYLFFTLPTTDIFIQDNIVGNFKAVIDANEYSFTVIKSGVDNYNSLASNFLMSNFLTWQPNELEVRRTQPTWLSYYNCSAGSLYLKIKYYKKDSSSIIRSHHSIPAGKCVSYNMQFDYIFNLEAGDKYAYYDVWVENGSSERLTYIQRYIYIASSEADKYFLFDNSLGGIDSVCFTGENKFNPTLAFENASYDEQLYAENKHETIYVQNSGYKTNRECVWLKEFIGSVNRYVVKDGALYPIVLSDGEVSISASDSLNSIEFNYKLSQNSSYLNLPRTTILTENLKIEVPDSLFFLAPRLLEFASATLSDNLLFPVQLPFNEVWQQISWGAIREYVAILINNKIDPTLHFHDNKVVLNKFSVDVNGKLLFDGAEIGGSGSGHEHSNKNILDLLDKSQSDKLTFNNNQVVLPEWENILNQLGIDTEGNLYVKDNKGFYTTSFLSARGLDSTGGSGGGMDWGALVEYDGDIAHIIHTNYIPNLAMSKVIGLADAFTGKANVSHNHTMEQVTGLAGAFELKADKTQLTNYLLKTDTAVNSDKLGNIVAANYYGTHNSNKNTVDWRAKIFVGRGMHLYNETNPTRFMFVFTGETALIYHVTTDGKDYKDLCLGTTYNSLYRKASNGFWGVNNINPTEQLHVIGNTKTSGNAIAAKFIGPLQGNADTTTLATRLKSNDFRAYKPIEFENHGLTFAFMKGNLIASQNYQDMLFLSGWRDLSGKSTNALWFDKVTGYIRRTNQAFNAEEWGTPYLLWDASNSNKADVDWTCNNLTITENATAKKFVGALQGNADTATNATKLGNQLPTYYATALALTTEVTNRTNADTALSNRVKVFEDLFEVDINGDIKVKSNKGLYTTSFLSTRGLDTTQQTGGGMDWSALITYDENPEHIIHPSYLPAIAMEKVTGLSDALASKSNNTHNHNTVYSQLAHKHDDDYSSIIHNHNGVYEPIFTKNTAFNKNFGTATGTVCQGNDARLSDARTPLAHTQAMNTITGLADALSGKATKVHTHVMGDVTGLADALALKANASSLNDYLLKSECNNANTDWTTKDVIPYAIKNGNDYYKLYVRGVLTPTYGTQLFMPFDNGSNQSTYRIQSAYASGSNRLEFGLATNQVYGSDPTEVSYSTLMTLDKTGVLNIAGWTVTQRHYLNNNGVASNIYSQNASYLHYTTNAPFGHWFNTKVEINGNLSVSGGISASQYVSARGLDPNSDERLKENITPIDYSVMSMLNSLRVKTYNWKDDNRKGIGVIAQEMKNTSLKDLVHKHNDFYSVDLYSLSMLTLKGVQEHDSKIVQLEKEVKRLKNKLEELGYAS